MPSCFKRRHSVSKRLITNILHLGPDLYQFTHRIGADE